MNLSAFPTYIFMQKAPDAAVCPSCALTPDIVVQQVRLGSLIEALRPCADSWGSDNELRTAHIPHLLWHGPKPVQPKEFVIGSPH